MPTYFVFEKTTREGMISITDSPKRTEGLESNAAKFGVSVLEWFYLSGPFDFLLKVEAVDDESMEAFVMATQRGGNVSMQYARAYLPEAWKALVARVPAPTT